MSIIAEIKNIKSGPKQLRDFGLVMGIFLGLIGGLLFWRGRPASLWFLTPAVLFFILGLVWPQVLRPLQKVWMALAVMMGYVMSRVILFLLFYLAITPIGLFLKLTGKDLLNIKINKGDASYWLPKKPGSDKSSYEKQF